MQLVIVGVNADLVAVFRHAPDKGLLTLDAVAHQEEGGLDLPESQTVQQAGGGGGSGAVVKGESHQGGLLRHRPPTRRPLPLRLALGRAGTGPPEAVQAQGPASI